MKGARVWIKDNGSTNGTRLNGILLHQEVEASFVGAFDDEIVTYTVTFVLDDKENNIFSLDNLSINNRSAGILMTNAFIEGVFGEY